MLVYFKRYLNANLVRDLLARDDFVEEFIADTPLVLDFEAVCVLSLVLLYMVILDGHVVRQVFVLVSEWPLSFHPRVDVDLLLQALKIRDYVVHVVLDQVSVFEVLQEKVEVFRGQLLRVRRIECPDNAPRSMVLASNV